METVKFNLDSALRDAIKEINERMVSIETDIKRIRKAREGEKEQRRRVRREVVTYYEGYSEKVKFPLDKLLTPDKYCFKTFFNEG